MHLDMKYDLFIEYDLVAFIVIMLDSQNIRWQSTNVDLFDGFGWMTNMFIPQERVLPQNKVLYSENTIVALI